MKYTPKDRRGGGGEGDENFVHAEHHHRADGLHDDGGDAHAVDAGDDPPVRTEAPELELNVVVPGQVEEDGQAGGQDLPQDGGQGGSRHLHPGEAEQSEDQNGVHDDVDNGAHRLGDHGVEGAAGGLEHPVKGDLYKQPYRQPADDGHVLCAVVHNGLLAGLHLEKEPGAGQADGHEHQAAEDGQKQAVHGGGVGPALAALAQALGQQGVDAHAGSHGHGDHQILDREGQRDGVQRVLADLGHKVAVHHVVEGLHQHGDHHGDGHGQQEPVDRHGRPFCFPQGADAHASDTTSFFSLSDPGVKTGQPILCRGQAYTWPPAQPAIPWPAAFLRRYKGSRRRRQPMAQGDFIPAEHFPGKRTAGAARAVRGTFLISTV